jgi:hypothetical protein
MSRSKTSLRLLSWLLFAAAGAHCSAGGAPGSAGVVGDGSGNGAPVLPPGNSVPPAEGANDPAFLIGDPGDAIDSNGNPINIGSEAACDGVDENQNGIVDDVDKGKDGLCDCLHIGFLGALASDAGNKTGAFETWLEERSDIPVTHIAARDPLTAESLAGLQVLVIGNLSERANGAGYSAAEVEVLRHWIETDAGGVISLAGYTAREGDVVPTVALLAPTGLGYDYKGRGPGVLGIGAPPVIVRGIVSPNHPTMDGIHALGVYNAYPVTGDGEVIVSDGAFNLAMAKTFGAGHVFAFSDEWVTQDALWSPMLNRPLTPCQQGCNQCKNQCASCDQQCTACLAQPCQGGQVVPDGGTCVRGCDQGCSSCSTNCQSCEQVCGACSALEQQDQLDIPRFWLNVIRWLTPANECQVPVPPTVVF